MNALARRYPRTALALSIALFLLALTWFVLWFGGGIYGIIHPDPNAGCHISEVTGRRLCL